MQPVVALRSNLPRVMIETKDYHLISSVLLSSVLRDIGCTDEISGVRRAVDESQGVDQVLM